MSELSDNVALAFKRCNELERELQEAKDEIARQKRERGTDQHLSTMEMTLKNNEISRLRADNEKLRRELNSCGDLIRKYELYCVRFDDAPDPTSTYEAIAALLED